MSYFNQLPRKLKILEIASRAMLFVFGFFLLTLQNCQRDFYIYFLGNDITVIVWLCGIATSLALSIVLEVISLSRQKNLGLQTKESKSRFIKDFVIFVILLFVLSIALVSPCSSSKKARDSRILSAIAQARTVMQYIYGSDNNYDNFNCNSPNEEIKSLCQDIDKQYQQKEKKFFEIELYKSPFYGGDNKEPVIAHFPKINSHSACIYSPLNMKDGNANTWYCADSTGKFGFTSINPGLSGYCIEGESAVCPEAKQ